MSWFRRGKKGIKAHSEKKDTPEGVWLKCDACAEILYRPELERSFFVCQKCGYHFRIRSRDYLNLLVDEGSFVEEDAELAPADPLQFRDSQRYPDRIAAARKKTGLNDAIVAGRGTVAGMPTSIAFLDFGYMGGSMGSVVGERIARVTMRAADERRPVITLSASGGARMQEGILSLMQMAKTSAALARLAEVGQPHISILTHPTTGGVTASFASLGDVILAEPKALIGFAGPRVIRETINQELPEGFQRSEFLEEHGFVDRVVPRRDLRDTVAGLLQFFGEAEMSPPAPRRRRDD
ncbi:MAG: acetyl-CoA carboxylase carboxyltransferase subunit beta [Gemmatimonadetes bacterium]|nr:acetyl-CoA carboxylase carboxyltransferase subunit beta [Gemmatimonadota bacterium]